ncbi:LysM peptidoglycan-binding domain-containing protein [Geitlerinema calcuttense]|uniref:LysM peptidoglycan-binding domain-containing protein n=1 Tax=Geitlerinema calcuttense NRMC-F 0142 TaxID=2922238 RepID=A0ABT7LV37_9CYAN|nr:LysM peptidoglycan-binding domain-containing protein [Geitlerinema calcuttense]MDL5055908.1 LysM peptidoglycan-binding domain-containing protein [Geitlerinema calcuttense NRMC-F 0142]
MSYRIAKSLGTLRSQVNAAYPNRDKASDGWIGDAAHAKNTSDHNPWIKIKENSKTVGIVTALDIDKDLSATEKVGRIVDALVLHKDKRIKYIIWNSRIISSYAANGYAAWVWRPYSGKNKHTEHVHISVKAEQQFFDDASDWRLDVSPATPHQPVPEPFVENVYVVQSGDTMTKIAKSFHTTVDALAALNGIADANKLSIGQRLKTK